MYSSNKKKRKKESSERVKKLKTMTNLQLANVCMCVCVCVYSRKFHQRLNSSVADDERRRTSYRIFVVGCVFLQRNKKKKKRKRKSTKNEKSTSIVRKRIRQEGKGRYTLLKRDPKCGQAEAAVICLNRGFPRLMQCTYVIAKRRCVDGHTFYRLICFRLWCGAK